MADVTSWLPNLLGPIDIFVNGAATGVPRRPAYNFIGSGIAVVDNPSADRIDVTIPAGGGAAPTGTGFRHVTSNTEDVAARAVNLASADVTGILPTANQAAQSVGGDSSGTTAAMVNNKVNGTTYPAGGSLTSGTVPIVSGASAVTYGAISLANANSVSGTLPYANLPPCFFFHVARAVATSNVASLSGTTTIDGVALIAGDRVLLVGQTTASQNGIWLVAAGAWSRPADWNTGGPALAENWIGISEGTAGAHAVYRVTTQGSIAVGLTSVSIAQYAGASDATTSSKGIVELANDLAGTAAAPVVQQITGVSGLVTLLATIEEWISSSTNSKCRSYIFNATTSATTANQTIATIPIVSSSGGNGIDAVVVARQGSNGYKGSIDTLYLDVGAGPVHIGTEHYGNEVTTLGGTQNLNTTASGANVLVRVTPGSASSTTWTTIVQKTVAT